MVAHYDKPWEQSDEDISVDFPFVGLIYHDHAVGVQHVVRTHLVQQNTVSQILDESRGAVLPLMPHLKPYSFSKFRPHFLSHSSGQSNRCQSPGLRDGDLSKLMVVLFDEELSYLRALAWACLSADESDEMLVDGLHYFLFLHVDG